MIYKAIVICSLFCFASDIYSDTPKKDHTNMTGSITNAEITGITIINGKLWIDGRSIPYGARTFKSTATGKTYNIEWGPQGNISVSEASK